MATKRDSVLLSLLLPTALTRNHRRTTLLPASQNTAACSRACIPGVCCWRHHQQKLWRGPLCQLICGANHRQQQAAAGGRRREQQLRKQPCARDAEHLHLRLRATHTHSWLTSCSSMQLWCYQGRRVRVCVDVCATPRVCAWVWGCRLLCAAAGTPDTMV